MCGAETEELVGAREVVDANAGQSRGVWCWSGRGVLICLVDEKWCGTRGEKITWGGTDTKNGWPACAWDCKEAAVGAVSEIYGSVVRGWVKPDYKVRRLCKWSCIGEIAEAKNEGVTATGVALIRSAVRAAFSKGKSRSRSRSRSKSRSKGKSRGRKAKS